MKKSDQRFVFVAMLDGVEGGPFLGADDTLEKAQARADAVDIGNPRLDFRRVVRCQIGAPWNFSPHDGLNRYKSWVRYGDTWKQESP